MGVVNLFNMETKDLDKIKKIVDDFKNHSNNDLIHAMNILQKDFEETKEMLVKVSFHLDATESLYNNILKEYQKRTKS